MPPRRLAALGAAAVLLTGGAACSASVRPTAADHRDPVRTTTTTAAPTSTVPSATPTTVEAPVVAVPGWSAPSTTLPPGGGFTAVSCLSDVFCVAVGGGANEADATATTGSGVTQSWDGAAWSPPSVYFPAPATGPVTAPELPSVACTGGPTCTIVDGSGHVSTGDGTDWSAPAPLPAAQVVAANPFDPGPGHPGSRSAAVACAAPGSCAYVDNTGHAAASTGGTWSVPQTLLEPVGPAVALYQTGRVGLACTGPSACTAAVGTAVLDWNGTSWRTEPSPFGLAGMVGDSAVACPTAALCAIVHGTAVSVRSLGGTWSAPTVIDPAGDLDALACPTADRCLAADGHGNVLTWSGGAWSAPAKVIPAPVDYAGDGTTLACPTAGFCMVLNGDGDYATFQGPGSSP